MIVALTHDDLADDRDLARQVEAIDLILGGHDHDPMTFDDGGTLIVKAGHDAHYLAAVDLAVERVQRGGEAAIEVVPTAWRYISTAGVAPDPEVQAVVARYEEQLDQEFALPVGTTTVMLDSRRSTVRTGESNFGDLITDVMRQAVGAEVALMNAGGIRGDRTYAARHRADQERRPDRAAVRQCRRADRGCRARICSRRWRTACRRSRTTPAASPRSRA